MSSRAPVKPSGKRIRRQRQPKSRQLKYCHSVTRNRGFVKFPAAACGGKRITEWLPGKYQSPESLAAFEKSLGFFLLHGTAPPWVGKAVATTHPALADDDGPTVEELCRQFEKHKLPGYSYSEQCNYRSAMRDLCSLYAARPADSIGKRELLEVRAMFVRSGKCLKGCNGQTRRVKALFQWAADHELVPDSVPLNLQALRNLKHGEAPTPPRKQAVSDELVQRTCQHLPRRRSISSRCCGTAAHGPANSTRYASRTCRSHRATCGSTNRPSTKTRIGASLAPSCSVRSRWPSSNAWSKAAGQVTWSSPDPSKPTTATPVAGNTPAAPPGIGIPWGT